MARFLHLSDIHLGVGPSQFIDDYKSDIVPEGERANRIEILKRTLATLGNRLRQESKSLDAVIISGDITIANNLDGFAMLKDVLSSLGASLPDASRILAVPGNHDVTWMKPPSVPERYELFLQHVRAHGYATPILDGVDSYGGSSSLADMKQHYILSPDFSWLILPINSSNYCGTLESVSPLSERDWERLPSIIHSALSSVSEDALKKLLRTLRLRDIPRISHYQFDKLSTLLEKIDAFVAASGGDPARIRKVLVLHHHLLPVSTSEEFKAFESVVNLGLLRTFLGSCKASMVLHGHKHTDQVYTDHVQDFGTDVSHQVLVVSGPTVGQSPRDNDTIFKLIELDGANLSPTAKIVDIPAVRPGLSLPSGLTERKYFLWANAPSPDSSSSMYVIRGGTTDEAYARLMQLFDSLPNHTALSGVVVQISDGQSAHALPSGYPSEYMAAHGDPQTVFSELVAWWQREVSRLAPPMNFNHGSRMAEFGQLENAITSLIDKPDTSRAIAVLVNPERDLVPGKGAFPSFCLVQFVIRSGKSGMRFLDVFAFFRKQEMRHWWPVNVAEMAALQQRVLEQILRRHDDVKAGTLTTIAACAVVGGSIPRVAVPLVDRQLDEDPDFLWSMVYALFNPQLPDRDKYREGWARVLKDLIPKQTPAADGDPVAIDGLIFLHQEVIKFSAHHASTGRAARLASKLQQILEHNRLYERTVASGTANEPTHKKWRLGVEDLVREVEALVAEMFAA